jgi:hypothetical protein
MGFDPRVLPDFAQMAALAAFSAKYVKGFLTGGSYEAIPLERNAHELDAEFAKAPGDPFFVF